MPKILYRVTLTQEERVELQQLSTRGKHGSQKVLDALILLGCDEGNFQERKQTAVRLGGLPPFFQMCEKYRTLSEALECNANLHAPAAPAHPR
jgi:hypothetical protein